VITKNSDAWAKITSDMFSLFLTNIWSTIIHKALTSVAAKNVLVWSTKTQEI
jgi:putative effector of murein hydrolase LrgA (UPF0299 family)